MNKTVPNDASVMSFLATIEDEEKRRDSEALIAMMQEVSSQPAVMWGPSIIGFGTYHYTYETGREGDMPEIGFSPRKANVTIYINQGFDEFNELLEDLGAFTTSVSCLYIKQLSDVNKDILQKIITRSYTMLHADKQSPNLPTIFNSVDDYINGFSEPQHRLLQKIRTTVKNVVPNATEKISYKIAAFQLNGKMLLYYAGFKDHVSMYPIPHGMEKELKQYVHGRGTLWFALDKPLPVELIEKVALAHAEARQYGAKKY